MKGIESQLDIQHQQLGGNLKTGLFTWTTKKHLYQFNRVHGIVFILTVKH